ncbi:MAG: hypothetical protein VW147_06685 [Bacteroidota bacterium]|jgi:hypothetical protein
MKFISALSLVFLSIYSIGQTTVGLVIEPSFNLPQFKKSTQSDSIKKIHKPDLTISFGIDIKKQLDRYNAIRFIPGFHQSNLLTVKENLQFLDIIHPALPEIKDLTQSASKIARVRYRQQYIGSQIIYNRQLQLLKIPPKLNIEIGGGMGLYYLIHHSVKVNTEGFAINNKFVTTINDDTKIDPNSILIQVLLDANVLYNITPNYTISGGLKIGLPITNTNSELFTFRMYNTGLRISLSKLI